MRLLLQKAGRILFWFILFGFCIFFLTMLFAVLLDSPILEAVWQVLKIYIALAIIVIIFGIAERLDQP